MARLGVRRRVLHAVDVHLERVEEQVAQIGRLSPQSVADAGVVAVGHSFLDDELDEPHYRRPDAPCARHLRP